MARVCRRSFVGGMATALGAAVLPARAWAAMGEPKLRFGVVSDVHIGGRKEAPQRLEATLKWLDAKKVDAVLFPGDIAHTGQIRQMEQFAAIWNRFFPKQVAVSDGRRVEIMISTGNHDAWEMGLAKQTEENKRKNWLFYSDNAARTWHRLFGETFEPVWRKEVRGYTFLGAQWPTFKPELEKYMAAHGKELDPTKPFFYCQHEHPKGTCHGSYGCGYDRGQSVRALSPYPNAVAFSGHSHCSPLDERAVWQGAFTSIGAGCLHEGGLAFGHDNCTAFWHPSYKKNLQGPLNDHAAAWGGDPDGGCFLYVEVFDGHLVVERRSSVYGLPLGPAWDIPVPSKQDGPFDFAKRKACRVAPQFGADASLKVEVCPQGSPLATPTRRKEPCVRVVVPNAGPVDGCRVFDYEMTAVAGGKTLAKGRVFAAGFSLPAEQADRPTDWLVALADLPKGEDVIFTATPCDCFGVAGRTLSSAPFRIEIRA